MIYTAKHKTVDSVEVQILYILTAEINIPQKFSKAFTIRDSVWLHFVQKVQL